MKINKNYDHNFILDFLIFKFYCQNKNFHTWLTTKLENSEKIYLTCQQIMENLHHGS